MEIKYEREIGHCEVSQYVKLVTIDTVSPAENSDNLERITFKEMGWNAICQKGLHTVNTQVMFIPPESVLPFELSEKLSVTKYLNKGRVKVTRLRGNRSEGLIVPIDIVEPYLPYIMKWEDLPTVEMNGQQERAADINPDFIKFYKMPNILNEPNTFKKGDSVYYSEKIHGTNFRFAYLQNPVTEEYQYYVGSHNCVLKETEGNLYWEIFNNHIKQCNIPADIVFFAEIYGVGIQHLTYNTQPIFKVFAATIKGDYITVDQLKQQCGAFNLPIVKFHKIEFDNLEQIRELADAGSEVCKNSIREGVVLVSEQFPEKMAKCIGFKYQTSKNKTERH